MPWFRHDPLEWLPYRVVLQAVVLGAALATVDILLGELPSTLSEYEIEPPERAAYVTSLLAFAGIPTALLLTLSSFALSSMSPAISSSLPLLFLRYPWPWLPRVPAWSLVVLPMVTTVAWYVSLGTPDHSAAVGAALVAISVAAALALVTTRTNLLHLPLLLASSLTSGLLLMSFVSGRGVSNQHLLTLGLVFVFLLVDAGLLVALVIWLMRLRQSGELVTELQKMGESIQAYVASTRDGHLPRASLARLAEDAASVSQPQQELKQVFAALSQVALHALQEHQNVPALQAARAIDTLHERASRGEPRTDWLVERAEGVEGSVATPWIDRLSCEQMMTILLRSAEQHFFSVGDACAQHLLDIALRCLREHDGRVRPAHDVRSAIPIDAVEAFASCYDECVQFDEVNLRDRVLFFATRLIEAMRAAGPNYTNDLREELPIHLRTAGRLAVSRNDVGAVRALLSVLGRYAADDVLRAPVARAVIDLGALALAGRSYAVGSVLIDWLRRFDDRGAFVPSVATARMAASPTDDETAPPELTRGFVQVFLALACARGRVGRGATWPDAALAQVRDLLGDVGRERCQIVLARLNNSVPLPDELARAWRWQVDELTSAR
jgi:hypothetical protein